MIQQAITEENYAGPSFDYNSTSKQFFGDQLSQQG